MTDKPEIQWNQAELCSACLLDARLAVAALEEAESRSIRMPQLDDTASAALGKAIGSARAAVAALMDYEKGAR